MKANRASLIAALALCAGLAACSQPRETPPPRTPAPTPVPRALPPPPALPRTSDWRDVPITPGTWRWRMEGSRSVARFAQDVLVLSCNRETGMITLIRHGSGSGEVPLTIRTATVSRTLSAAAQPGPPPVITLSLPARDGLLDAMAFSRGRFAVETAGLPTLYLPSWAEVSRVVEDCR